MLSVIFQSCIFRSCIFSRPGCDAMFYVTLGLYAQISLQFLVVVKATASEQQVSKFYPHVISTEASYHIYTSEWLVINVGLKATLAIVCAYNDSFTKWRIDRQNRSIVRDRREPNNRKGRLRNHNMWHVTCSPRPPTLLHSTATWISTCGHTRDLVVYSRFHWNPFGGFGATGCWNLHSPPLL